MQFPDFPTEPANQNPHHIVACLRTTNLSSESGVGSPGTRTGFSVRSYATLTDTRAISWVSKTTDFGTVESLSGLAENQALRSERAAGFVEPCSAAP